MIPIVQSLATWQCKWEHHKQNKRIGNGSSKQITTARMQPILDFPFDLRTPTNRGERLNLFLQHLLTQILANMSAQSLCPNYSLWGRFNFWSDKKLHPRCISFDRYKSLVQFWAAAMHCIMDLIWVQSRHSRHSMHSMQSYALHNGYLGAQSKNFEPALIQRGNLFKAKSLSCIL